VIDAIPKDFSNPPIDHDGSPIWEGYCPFCFEYHPDERHPIAYYKRSLSQ